MKTAWKSGLDKQVKLDVEHAFKASHVIRERLSVMLEAKINAAEKGNSSKEGYDCPNWAYKQADLVGYKRSIKEILSLLED